MRIQYAYMQYAILPIRHNPLKLIKNIYYVGRICKTKKNNLLTPELLNLNQHFKLRTLILQFYEIGGFITFK